MLFFFHTWAVSTLRPGSVSPMRRCGRPGTVVIFFIIILFFGRNRIRFFLFWALVRFGGRIKCCVTEHTSPYDISLKALLCGRAALSTCPFFLVAASVWITPVEWCVWECGSAWLIHPALSPKPACFVSGWRRLSFYLTWRRERTERGKLACLTYRTPWVWRLYTQTHTHTRTPTLMIVVEVQIYYHFLSSSMVNARQRFNSTALLIILTQVLCNIKSLKNIRFILYPQHCLT